jgi:S1-C subfamily serine protease
MSALTEFSDAVTDLAESVRPRIVTITGSGGRQSSGFVWASGLVIASEEVLDGDEQIKVGWDGGRETSATVKGRDPSTDVALLEVDTGEFADWPAASVPKPGALALIAGRKRGALHAYLVSVPEVGPAWESMRGGKIDSRAVLHTRLSPRLEGAAVIAPEGGLLGMAVTSARRETIVIPTSTIARAVATLLARGYVPSSWIGVMLMPLNRGSGLIVTEVQPQSPAEAAGLLVGDVITTWKGQGVSHPSEVARGIRQEPVGSKVTIGVSRAGAGKELDVVVGERPRR